MEIPNEKPLISVIVPVYNIEGYLEKCIDSIINQTYNNLEILLIDDGATDNSGNICDAFAEKDARIQVIHKSNGGLSDARNVGMKAATGQLIGFVDGDDWIEKNMYEELYDVLEKYDSDVSVCGVNRIYGTEVISPKEDKVFCCTGFKAAEYNLTLNNDFQFYTAVWNKLYRRELIEDLEFPYGKYFEDIVFTAKALTRARRCAYVSKPLYNYIAVREGSIMNQGFTIRDLTDKTSLILERSRFFYESGHNRLAKLSDIIKADYLIKCHSRVRFSIITNKKWWLKYLDSNIREIELHLRTKNRKYKSLQYKLKLYKISPLVMDFLLYVKCKLYDGGYK